MEAMILNRKDFLINAFIKHKNKSCNYGLEIVVNGKSLFCMYRVEYSKLSDTLIILN